MSGESLLNAITIKAEKFKIKISHECIVVSCLI